MEKQERNSLTQILRESRNLVFFGGAGVSTESGIPDFRSAEGIYRQNTRIPPETILSHSFFQAHPAEFFTFYRRHMLYPDAVPNRAHRALARLEDAGKLHAVITQNIDGLHQAAGCRHVLELHGSVHRNYCTGCGKFYPLSYILSQDGCPRCADCGAIVKPDVVLYEEPLDEVCLNHAIRAISCADTLLIGGTSLTVYPAAGLIRYFRGNHLVIINKSPTPQDERADLLLCDSIGETLDNAVEALIN